MSQVEKGLEQGSGYGYDYDAFGSVSYFPTFGENLGNQGPRLNGAGAFPKPWYHPGSALVRGKEEDLAAAHKDLPGSFGVQHLSNEGCNAIQKDKGFGVWHLSNEGYNSFQKDKVNESMLGHSSWDTHRTTQFIVHAKNVWDERTYENGVYSLTKPLPSYLTSRMQDFKSLNYGSGAFDQEHGSSNTLEVQGPLNLAQYGSFKATHTLKVSKEEPRMQYEEDAPDVTLSLSLPSLREPAISNHALNYTSRETTKPMGSLALGSLGRPNNAQLTLFYGGNVNVYDNVPMEKAKSIMLWAGSESGCPFSLPRSAVSRPCSPSLHPTSGFYLPEGLQSPMVVDQTLCLPLAGGTPQLNLSSVPCGRKHQEPAIPTNPLTTCPVMHKVLPQARKASLARFLQKRKERIHVNTAYAMKSPLECTLSQGDTELSTNCRAACPPMEVSDECDDEKMAHTSKGVVLKMGIGSSAEHDSHQAIDEYDAEAETNTSVGLAVDA